MHNNNINNNDNSNCSATTSSIVSATTMNGAMYERSSFHNTAVEGVVGTLNSTVSYNNNDDVADNYFDCDDEVIQ